MKIRIGKERPAHFREEYPGQFEIVSHMECAVGVPQVLFAITTWKENGKPNVCFHSWACFHGDKTAFFAVMGNLFQHTHTYANIRRDNCFALNFLPLSQYDRLLETIAQNGAETDEFAAGGFTLERAQTVAAPVIAESFMTMECTLHSLTDLTGAGITAMVVGEVQSIAVEEAYARGYGRRYGEDGYMLLIPAPQNLVTGEAAQSGVAVADFRRLG